MTDNNNFFAGQATMRQKAQTKIEKKTDAGLGMTKPERTTFTLSITKADKNKFQQRALDEGLTAAGLFHKMLEIYLGER